MCVVKCQFLLARSIPHGLAICHERRMQRGKYFEKPVRKERKNLRGKKKAQQSTQRCKNQFLSISSFTSLHI